MTTISTIPMTLRQNSSCPTLESDHVLVWTTFRYPKRFGVGAVPRGSEARQIHGGPMVPGPWAYTFPLCSVLAANPEMSTGAEMRRLAAAGKVHEVATGDQVEIDRIVYTIQQDGYEHIKLVPAGSWVRLTIEGLADAEGAYGRGGMVEADVERIVRTALGLDEALPIRASDFSVRLEVGR